MIATFASIVLVLILFGMVFWTRSLSARGSDWDEEEPVLYAAAIIRELNSPAHRLLAADPQYRHRLFRRYAPMLKEDMAHLMELGISPRRYFWYATFRFFYALLSMKHVPQLLRVEEHSLQILVGTMYGARGSGPVTGLS